MNNAEKIQAVINTIELLEPIRPSFDNASKLWGIYKTLAEVRDDLMKEQAEEVKEDGDREDAEADPE